MCGNVCQYVYTQWAVGTITAMVMHLPGWFKGIGDPVGISMVYR